MNTKHNGKQFEYEFTKSKAKKKAAKTPCPFCGKLMEDCSDVLIKEVKGSTILLRCNYCGIILGSYT